jgi:drug/metabolite transporter (DMT)-like permease
VSAVVAILFAALSFVNLVMFRLIFGQREPRSAWIAAALGTAGVGLLSWSEIVQARLEAPALVGLAMALPRSSRPRSATCSPARGEAAGVPLAASMAWSMGYGTGLLTLFALTTGRPWTFDARAPYVLSLLYLALIGSVVAFLLYFGVARRRGYSTASYILALTPLLAMAVSARLEGKRWSAMGIGGVGLVLLGQWLLLRTRQNRSLAAA